MSESIPLSESTLHLTDLQTDTDNLLDIMEVKSTPLIL